MKSYHWQCIVEIWFSLVINFINPTVNKLNVKQNFSLTRNVSLIVGGTKYAMPFLLAELGTFGIFEFFQRQK